MKQQTPYRAFTLVEMLVVLVIISILASMILPSLSRAREGARRVSCSSNLRQIGVAFSMYVEDYDERYPLLSSLQEFEVPTPLPPGCPTTRTLSINWSYELNPYTKSAQIFRCPSTGSEPRQPSAATEEFVLWDDCDPPPPTSGPLPPPPPPNFGGNGGGGVPIGCPSLDIEFPQPDYALNTMLRYPNAWQHSTINALGHGFITPETKISQCSFGPPGATTGLLVHQQPESAVNVQRPSETILLADAQDENGKRPTASNFSQDLETDFGSLPPSGTLDELAPHTFVGTRHLGGYNALFADGHVKFVPWGTSHPQQWTIEDD